MAPRSLESSIQLQSATDNDRRIYERPLQTALDDTLGGEARWDQLEPNQGVPGAVIGTINIGASDELSKPVFSAEGLGPDISKLDCTSGIFGSPLTQLWVKDPRY